MTMRALVVAAIFGLSACASYPPIGPGPGPGPGLPASGPIAYRCADGTQLMVDFENNQARVAIVGGPSMVLPNAGEHYYSNGRYGIRGGGASAQWEVGRAAPVSCRGS
jgi:hypothetical protein